MARPPSSEALARVVRWVILIFIAYAILSGSWHVLPEKQPPAPPAPAKAPAIAANATLKEKDCAPQAPNALQNFSQMATTIMPSFVPFTRTQEIKPGEGEAASCGQHATLRYQLTTDSGQAVFSNLKGDATTDIVIGDDKLLRGMEMGLLGMKPGGERRIAFPPAFGFARMKDRSHLVDVDKYAIKPDALKGEVLVGDMSLVSVSPALPSSSMPLRVIEQPSVNVKRAQCGDVVRVDMSIWKTDGTKIFSTDDTHEPVTFTLGMSQAPYGIEQAIMGMSEDGSRTAIIPPAFTHPLLTDVPWDKTPILLGADITWPQETLLMNVHLQSIGSNNTVHYTVSTAAKAKPAEDKPKDKAKTDKDDNDDEPDEKK